MCIDKDTWHAGVMRVSAPEGQPEAKRRQGDLIYHYRNN